MVRNAFNTMRRLEVQGTVSGKPVRLRVFVSPRFLVRNFPTGKDADTYYNGLGIVQGEKTEQGTKKKESKEEAYARVVNALSTETGVHCEVDVVAKGTSELSDAALQAGDSTPRKAHVVQSVPPTSTELDPVFNEGILTVFLQLLAIDGERIDDPRAYLPAVSGVQDGNAALTNPKPALSRS